MPEQEQENKELEKGNGSGKMGRDEVFLGKTVAMGPWSLGLVKAH